MSWYPMGIPPWPFSFTSLPEHVTFENGETGETVEYTQYGTCKNTQTDFDFMCSECEKCVDNGRILRFNYCPSCGRKIINHEHV